MSKSALRITIIVLAAALALIAESAPARTAAAAPLDSLIDRLFAVNDFAEVAISPDGKRVAWAEWLHEAWSRDGKRLAFLSDAAEAGQFQLYVADVTSGSPSVRKLTDLRGNLAKPQWSPDGMSIALLFIANAPRRPGPLEPMTAPSGEIEQHPFEPQLRTGRAITTGGWRSSIPSRLPRARRVPFTNRRCKSQFRAGRRTAGVSPSFRA